MLQSLKKYTNKIVLAISFKSVEAIIDLILPLVMAGIIDKGVMSGDLNYIIKQGTLMIIISTIGYASSIACNFFSVSSSQQFGEDLRNRLFSKIQTLSIDQLNNFNQSSLLTRVSKDVTQVVMMTMMSMRMVLRGLVTGVGSVIFSFMISPKLALILLFIVPITIWTTYYYMKKSVPLYSSIQKKLDNLTLILRENFLGIRVIKALSKELIEEDRFEVKNKKLSEKIVKADNTMDSKTPFIGLLINLGIVFILFSGIKEVNLGSVKPGEILAIINYLGMLLFSVNTLSFLFSMSSKTIISSKRINEILKQDSETYIKSSNLNSETDYILEFKNVNFTYNDHLPLTLKNINFSIKKKEKIAIVGSTGSGKTTLINLILRFYDATSGEIFFDGKNIKNYPLEILRNEIGIVSQKSFLFSQSIEENMRWVNPDATIEEIKESIRIAQGTEFVEKLPNAYQTIISKSGNNFSGGQKQRLSIARTILKNSKLYIFDDSFSALDFITESKLKKMLNEKLKNNTIIIISQRIISVMNSDKIIVMDNGEIVGFGTHSFLLTTCPIYIEICKSQGIENGGDEIER
ncbi:ABC transporter ATP-binding protein [Cetobacterium sp. 2A]|uniref:ABC transporter ATP-binding protein n=1 Tax=Cetobacterium sp. 2A TaxID=2754723 RepID=UPI00163C5AA5|nr:ABC transporter ATP-binding protein [Cetobacterium sp. 2A]MBC2857312.1 ABC transporter ATP-binding protein [Cetobacterium sp. 2A]